MTEPMSDEQLEAMRNKVYDISTTRPAWPSEVAYANDVGALLAEVERLRAALAVADNVIETAHEQDIIAGDLLDTLRAENAAMREIVRAVAACDNSDGVACFQLCPIRDLSYPGMDNEWYEHTGPCVFDQARALVAQWDTSAE